MQKINWQYHLNHAFWAGMDWVFPPDCAGCEKMGERWCADCNATVSGVTDPCCECCGLPVDKNQYLCHTCNTSRPRFAALRSWGVFDGPIRNALHRLKYGNDMALAESLAEAMLIHVRQLGWQADALVPIPISAKRLQERGYNQAALVAHPLAHLMRTPYQPQWLLRNRHTRSQVGLTRQERRANVQGAFIARPQVRNKRIIIFDDVATTGATLHEAAEALYEQGAMEVRALTIARALAHHDLTQV